MTYQDSSKTSDINKDSIPNINKDNQDQISTQKNMQDLDQEQVVDVKPSQSNFQNLEVVLNNHANLYTGQITGITYMQSNSDIASNVAILLYFGCSNQFPVYKTKSDENGNFTIPDLPPGYYTLKAFIPSYLEVIIPNIKILMGQNHFQTIVIPGQDIDNTGMLPVVNSRKKRIMI